VKEREKTWHANRGSDPGQPGRRRPPVLLLGSGLSLCTAALLAWGIHTSSPGKNNARPASLGELLVLPAGRIGEVPVAKLNLLCATGLCPTNDPDLQACAGTLETWAAGVCSETERHRYRFDRNPAEFENSAGFFRMLMLCVVLAEDYGVHYDAERRAGPAATRADDGFFADPSAVFVHGLLGPEHKGTCSSLPVLYAAVGRRLGYPLKLVTTRGHLFVRWEGEGERFNVEATARGLSRFADDYYRHWPFEVSPAEEAAEGYLRSLTAPEELAAFLSIRGMCLREQGRLSEAVESFAAAAKLAPGCRSYRAVLASLETALGRQRKRQELTLQTAGQSVRN
jgi:hypothetical protein